MTFALQLAPLELYGVGAMSSAITGAVRALMRGFGGGLRGVFCAGAESDRSSDAV